TKLRYTPGPGLGEVGGRKDYQVLWLTASLGAAAWPDRVEGGFGSVGEPFEPHVEVNRLPIGDHDDVVGKVSRFLHRDTVLTLREPHAPGGHVGQGTDVLFVHVHERVPRRSFVALEVHGDRSAQPLRGAGRGH